MRSQTVLELVSCTATIIVTETVLLEIVTIDLVTTDHQVLVRGWSRQYRRPITLAELQEINFNLAHFFSLMLSWDRQFRQQGLISSTDKLLDTHA